MGWRRTLLIALIAAAFSGCYSKTKIYSKPTGAQVVMDRGYDLGKTPIELEEMVWMWTKHQLTVSAPGHEPKTIDIRATGINAGYAVVCICTAGLLLPLGPASGYPPQYFVELTPLGAAQPAAGAPARPPLGERVPIDFR